MFSPCTRQESSILVKDCVLRWRSLQVKDLIPHRRPVLVAFDRLAAGLRPARYCDGAAGHSCWPGHAALLRQLISDFQ